MQPHESHETAVSTVREIPPEHGSETRLQF